MRARLALAGLLYCAVAAGDQTVNVGPGIAFSPANVVVAPGETVTWVWAGVFHSSTSDSQNPPEAWDSGVISTGMFSHTFTTPGTYPYYCQVHSFPGGTAMNGSVQVVGQASPTPTPTQTAPPAATPTSPPAATPTISRGAVPMLGWPGRLALALGLIAAAWTLLFLSRK